MPGAYPPALKTRTFADAAARTAAIPNFSGELGIQIDTNGFYHATGTSAGNWSAGWTMAAVNVDTLTTAGEGYLQLTQHPSGGPSLPAPGFRRIYMPLSGGISINDSTGVKGFVLPAGDFTYTLPGSTGTIVLRNDTATLTNKTISGTNNSLTEIPINGLTIASQAWGDIVFFNGSVWTRMAAGTSGQFLRTNGAGVNPSWANEPSTGTVTSVDVSGGSTGLTFSGGPITASGTITMAGTLAYANGGTSATSQVNARINLGGTQHFTSDALLQAAAPDAIGKLMTFYDTSGSDSGGVYLPYGTIAGQVVAMFYYLGSSDSIQITRNLIANNVQCSRVNALATSSSLGPHLFRTSDAANLDNVLEVQNLDSGLHSTIAFFAHDDPSPGTAIIGIGNSGASVAHAGWFSMVTNPPSSSINDDARPIQLAFENNDPGNDYTLHRIITIVPSTRLVTIYGVTDGAEEGPIAFQSNASGNVTLAPTSAGTVTIGGGATASELRIMEPSGSGTNYTAFKAQAQAANITYTLPPDDGDSGEVLSTDGSGSLTWVASGSGVWTTVKKTSDETIQSDDTISADSALTFNMLANTTYHVRMFVFFDTTAAADFKFGFDIPASPTLVRMKRTGIVPAATAYSEIAVEIAETSTRTLVGAGTTGGYVEWCGIVKNGANAGAWSFLWAQNTSTAADTTVLAGSYLEYTTF